MDNSNRTSSVNQHDQKKFFDFFRSYYKINQIQAQIVDSVWTRISKKQLFDTPHLISRIAINNTFFKNAFIVDCDHENIMGWIGLVPPPTYTVKNIVNDKHHHVWLLEDPVPLTGKYDQTIARDKTVRYIENIEHGLRIALDGDLDYRGKNSKNPLNTDLFEVMLWDHNTPLYKLDDFKDIVLQGFPTQRSIDLCVDQNATSRGRNCRIFEYTRLSAYPLASKFRNDPKGLLLAISEIAEAYNDNESIPLPDGEIRHIGKSIWKYILAGKSPSKFRKKSTDEEKKKNRIAGQQSRRSREIVTIEKQWQFYTLLQMASHFYHSTKSANLRTIEKNKDLYGYKSNPSSKCIGLRQRRQPETQRDALRSHCGNQTPYEPPPDKLADMLDRMGEDEIAQLRYEAALAFP